MDKPNWMDYPDECFQEWDRLGLEERFHALTRQYVGIEIDPSVCGVFALVDALLRRPQEL